MKRFWHLFKRRKKSFQDNFAEDVGIVCPVQQELKLIIVQECLYYYDVALHNYNLHCLHCGQCKSRCPYGLDTPKLLEKNYRDYQEVLAGKTSVC